MTIQKILQHAIKRLNNAACETPRLDAEAILMHIMGINRVQLIAHAYDPIDSNTQTLFNTAIDKRCKRMPVAYITGEKEFWSRSFKVNPDVLIPRPETEHLIEELLKIYPNQEGNYHFADIGTGSGCIAITLAAEYPNAHIIATDISQKALTIAKENAQRHQLTQHITFKHGNLYQAFDGSTVKLDAILSNPPYVSQNEMQQLEAELRYEPAQALSDNADGLHLLSALLKNAPEHLKQGGYLLLESGLCGLPKIPANMSKLHFYEDLAGLFRGGVYQYKSI